MHYAALNLWSTLIGSLFCLPVGWLFDRFDRRWVLAANLILARCGRLLDERRANSNGTVRRTHLHARTRTERLSVVSITIVSKAFEPRQLGLAMAWYSIMLAPLHLAPIIRGVGWALGRTAATTGGRCGPASDCRSPALSFVAAFLKSESSEAANSSREKAPHEDGATLGQALATPAFWIFSLTISLWTMIYSGVALFNEDIFKERGFSRELYFNVLAMVTVVSPWRVTWHSAGSRGTSRSPSCSASACWPRACVARRVAARDEKWHVYLYGVAMGIASGAVALLFFATWGRLYGRRELGRIQGIAQMMTVFASAGGPLLFALGKRETASYANVFLILSAVVAVLAVAVWFVPLPRFVSNIPGNSS